MLIVYKLNGGLKSWKKYKLKSLRAHLELSPPGVVVNDTPLETITP